MIMNFSQSFLIFLKTFCLIILYLSYTDEVYENIIDKYQSA